MIKLMGWAVTMLVVINAGMMILLKHNAPSVIISLILGATLGQLLLHNFKTRLSVTTTFFGALILLTISGAVQPAPNVNNDLMNALAVLLSGCAARLSLHQDKDEPELP